MLADAGTPRDAIAAGGFYVAGVRESEAAVQFYERHGFQRLVSAPMTLFLPLATAEKLLLGTH